MRSVSIAAWLWPSLCRPTVTCGGLVVQADVGEHPCQILRLLRLGELQDAGVVEGRAVRPGRAGRGGDARDMAEARASLSSSSCFRSVWLNCPSPYVIGVRVVTTIVVGAVAELPRLSVSTVSPWLLGKSGKSLSMSAPLGRAQRDVERPDGERGDYRRRPRPSSAGSVCRASSSGVLCALDVPLSDSAPARRGGP